MLKKSFLLLSCIFIYTGFTIASDKDFSDLKTVIIPRVIAQNDPEGQMPTAAVRNYLRELETFNSSSFICPPEKNRATQKEKPAKPSMDDIDE